MNLRQQATSATRLAQSTSALPSTSLPAAGALPPAQPLAHASSAPLGSGSLVACSWPPPQAPTGAQPPQQQPGFEVGAAPVGGGSGAGGPLQRRARGQRRPARLAGGLQRELSIGRRGSGSSLGALGLGFGLGSRAQSMEELGLIDGGSSGGGGSSLFAEGWGSGGGGAATAGAEPHTTEWFEVEMAQVRKLLARNSLNSPTIEGCLIRFAGNQPPALPPGGGRRRLLPATRPGAVGGHALAWRGALAAAASQLPAVLLLRRRGPGRGRGGGTRNVRRGRLRGRQRDGAAADSDRACLGAATCGVVEAVHAPAASVCAQTVLARGCERRSNDGLLQQLLRRAAAVRALCARKRLASHPRAVRSRSYVIWS
jgi:hypothetical protein